MEMKHNSAIKQLMREFNTQIALRETEIDSAVKEAIGKAEENSSNQIYRIYCCAVKDGK